MEFTFLLKSARVGGVGLLPAAGVCVACLLGGGAAAPPESLPGPQEMAAAETDVWGEAALRRPEGPSYEFFADLLPPLRYVNTELRVRND